LERIETARWSINRSRRTPLVDRSARVIDQLPQITRSAHPFPNFLRGAKKHHAQLRLKSTFQTEQWLWNLLKCSKCVRHGSVEVLEFFVGWCMGLLTEATLGSLMLQAVSAFSSLYFITLVCFLQGCQIDLAWHVCNGFESQKWLWHQFHHKQFIVLLLF